MPCGRRGEGAGRREGDSHEATSAVHDGPPSAEGRRCDGGHPGRRDTARDAGGRGRRLLVAPSSLRRAPPLLGSRPVLRLFGAGLLLRPASLLLSTAATTAGLLPATRTVILV